MASSAARSSKAAGAAGGGAGGAAAVRLTSRGEVLQFRSPAEFFAENQNIAGFDNPGKSLYTTIREFVENGLDACESIGKLPDIDLTIEELSPAKFKSLQQLSSTESSSSLRGASPELEPDVGATGGADASDSKTSAKAQPDRMYYRVTCKDNGVGMKHDAIPDMFGRVLAGSKYGVRQTRGKFGLGAKMALIWARKSTGLPVEVTTAYSRTGNPPSMVSYCKLDIDIHKNEPFVHVHKQQSNTSQMVGSEITVFISGNWTTYKARIVSYLQHLAIITPYAQFRMRFIASEKSRSFQIGFDRRSEQMPPLAMEIKHHPASVNNLIVRQLIEHVPKMALADFLVSEFSCVSKANAEQVVEGAGFDARRPCGELNPSEVHRLTTVLHDHTFPPPDGSCLSPAGEYNLRLGIMKELSPEYVATHSSAAEGFEGHPFIVEAGVAIGGKVGPEGVTVYRFANRIPLLFEAGADVATRVANDINWASYKIDQRSDRIGVFVSIVSTKIPFKGTGKEYIGSDITEIASVVKKCIQACCVFLKKKLAERNAERDRSGRKRALEKFAPDVARAVMGVLTQSKTRDRHTVVDPNLIAKRVRLHAAVDAGQLSEKILLDKLKHIISLEHAESLLQHAMETDPQITCFIAPLPKKDPRLTAMIRAPAFSFKLLQPFPEVDE